MSGKWAIRNQLQFDTAMLSDRGMVREKNEDSCFALETSQSRNSQVTYYGLYLIADGMGGHHAGEIASAKVSEIIPSTILENIKTSATEPMFSQLVLGALERANTIIYNMAQNNPALSGMGTTATLGLRVDNQLYIGHVGDSRAYLLRGEEIVQLTRDHSLVASLIETGMITREEAKSHPERNKIYRCLGNTPNVSIDTYREIGNADSLTLQIGDSLVFCTDGLTNYVSDKEVLITVNDSNSASHACQQLIFIANQRGGGDNISTIVVKSDSIK